jgi:hypothetical protein
LRELLLIGYLTHFGVHLSGNAAGQIQAMAIALSLLLVTNDLLWSVPGGILYFVKFRGTPGRHTESSAISPIQSSTVKS